MKTHPELLVRDALAGEFVAAAAGDAGARARIDELADWARGAGAPPQIDVEDGTPLFEERDLAARFSGQDDYARDRARRFAAACAWIGEADAWDDPLERARAAWDAGLFFEVHEIVEPVWLETRGPEREVLQGVIMAGAALHHLTRGNLAGARGLLGDAARRLHEAPGEQRFDLVGFADGLERLRAGIEDGSITHADDLAELPRLERAGGPVSVP